MQRTHIEWTDFSWNPIKGLCPVDCKLPDGKSYCYGKAIYNRFEWLQEGIGEIGYLAEWELEQPIKRKKPTKIFVCSTYELFHSPDKFARDEVFKVIEACPQHTFQILTKFPQNIDRPMPDNVWLGVSITKEEDLYRLTHLCSTQAMKRNRAKIRFVSFEPLLEFIQWSGFRLEFSALDWIIVGKLTGHGKKYEPYRYWINQIKFYAKIYGIPLFLKNNLKAIMKESLIQEMPDV